jgi:CHASE2 domain-containing sensor protein
MMWDGLTSAGDPSTEYEWMRQRMQHNAKDTHIGIAIIMIVSVGLISLTLSWQLREGFHWAPFMLGIMWSGILARCIHKSFLT